jgi:hypothetical protein
MNEKGHMLASVTFRILHTMTLYILHRVKLVPSSRWLSLLHFRRFEIPKMYRTVVKTQWMLTKRVRAFGRARRGRILLEVPY